MTTINVCPHCATEVVRYCEAAADIRCSTCPEALYHADCVPTADRRPSSRPPPNKACMNKGMPCPRGKGTHPHGATCPGFIRSVHNVPMKNDGNRAKRIMRAAAMAAQRCHGQGRKPSAAATVTGGKPSAAPRAPIAEPVLYYGHNGAQVTLHEYAALYGMTVPQMESAWAAADAQEDADTLAASMAFCLAT